MLSNFYPNANSDAKHGNWDKKRPSWMHPIYQSRVNSIYEYYNHDSKPIHKNESDRIGRSDNRCHGLDAGYCWR
jgi:hypothetical protein